MIALQAQELEGLLQAYRHATHAGSLEHPTHRYRAYNPACGDAITLELYLEPDDRVRAARYSGAICAVGTASASTLCTLLEQHSGGWLRQLTDSEFLSMLPYRVPRQRTACATMPLHAAQKALEHPL